jgi:hypothetical protein
VATIGGEVARLKTGAAGMSEYQYHEFLALDRPLTRAQREELRSISSRAEITATEFISEYQWGDLQGDPREMMERYFDAFMYWANLGTRQLMFRLPRDADYGGRQAVRQHRGLFGHFSEVDDEDVEPPLPAGLEDLTASLHAIVDFLGVDEDLIAVAAEGAPTAGRTAAELWRAASERRAALEKAGKK